MPNDDYTSQYKPNSANMRQDTTKQYNTQFDKTKPFKTTQSKTI